MTCTADPSGGLGVTFFDGPDLLATVPVNASGHATFTTGFNTTGTHTITAAYSGDGACDASNNTTTVNVSQSAPAPGTAPCLLLCSGPGLINFSTGNININNNNINNINGPHHHRGPVMAAVPSGL